MATLILDFDSTLIAHESLERVLLRGGVREVDLDRIGALTRRGMSGELSFRESLVQRLAIARPRRSMLLRVGHELADEIPDAAVRLVRDLAARGTRSWIVSGALREVLLPSAARLGIPDERVLGVSARWSGDDIAGLVDDGFESGKVAGVRAAALAWPRPSIVVGDGATDRALCEAGLVDHFVAFTGHVARPGVADAPGVTIARDFDEVGRVLETLLP